MFLCGATEPMPPCAACDDEIGCVGAELKPVPILPPVLLSFRLSCPKSPIPPACGAGVAKVT